MDVPMWGMDFLFFHRWKSAWKVKTHKQTYVDASDKQYVCVRNWIILSSPLGIDIANSVTVVSTCHSVITVSGARVVLAASYEKYSFSFS